MNSSAPAASSFPFDCVNEIYYSDGTPYSSLSSYTPQNSLNTDYNQSVTDNTQGYASTHALRGISTNETLSTSSDCNSPSTVAIAASTSRAAFSSPSDDSGLREKSFDNSAKRTSRVANNIKKFSSHPLVKAYLSKCSNFPHTSEFKNKIPNYGAVPAVLGRGSILAKNITDGEGKSIYSGRFKASDEGEQRARLRWKGVLQASNMVIGLFLDTGLPWTQQDKVAKAAAVLLLEMKVTAVSFCADHARAHALLSYRLARREFYKELEFNEGMLPRKTESEGDNGALDECESALLSYFEGEGV